MNSALRQIRFYTLDKKNKVLISSPWGSFLIKLFLALIVINLAVLNFFLLRENLAFDKARDMVAQSAGMMVAETRKNYEEIERFKKEIGAKIATASSARYFSPVSGESKQTVSGDFSHQMEYVKFPGKGISSSTTWYTVSEMEARFNVANFPNYTAWWEAYLMVEEGTASARLFDSFANIPIAGSEIQTSSSALEQVSSGPLRFPPGDRIYKVQIKSSLGSEAFIERSKIKISWIGE